MKALTYIEHGKFALSEKPKPEILDPRDAIVRVPLESICTSDLHIKHGSVPRADMYGKNFVFKTGGVDGCDCAEILALIEAGKIDTTPLITHRYRLEDIEEAYRIFENKLDGVIKVAIIT